MKITSLHLKNFKRFTDLKINLKKADGKAPRLVLLIGPNGCGKSSVFDSLEAMNKFNEAFSYGKKIANKENFDIAFKKYEEYYRKNIDEAFNIKTYHENVNNEEKIYLDTLDEFRRFGSANSKALPNHFYGRSAFRHVGEIGRSTIIGYDTQTKIDWDRPKRYIDNDFERFDNDIETYFQNLLSQIQKNPKNDFNFDSFKEKINKILENVLNNTSSYLIFKEIKTPISRNEESDTTVPAKILFEKNGLEIEYKNLSAGEKNIFTFVFDLLLKNKEFNDTIYFFDELDSHLNTEIQYNFLRKLVENTDIISDNCQIWIATHSLGFIQYARDCDDAVIIDFDNLDYEEKQIINPSEKNFDIVSLAIPHSLFERFSFVYCEGKDCSYYNETPKKDNSILKKNNKDILFISAGNKENIIYKIYGEKDFFGLVDRDFLTDKEIDDLKNYSDLKSHNSLKGKLFVLDYYSIENYLYHPDNLFDINCDEKIKYCDDIKKEIRDNLKNIIFNLQNIRNGYSFLKKDSKTIKIIRKDYIGIIEMLESEDFETSYKVFPMKDYAKNLKPRKNKRKSELAQTEWFKDKISKIFNP